MTATQTRPAVPNLTPVPAMLHHEDRITQLERENRELRTTVAELRETIDSITEVLSTLNCTMYRIQHLLRLNTAVDIAHNDWLTTLERLGRVELGGEGWTP